MRKAYSFFWLLVLGLALGVSCTRDSLRLREQAMRAVWTAPRLSDDLPLQTLVDGIKTEAVNLRAKSPGSRLVFGGTSIPVEDYADALEFLVQTAENTLDKGLLLKEIETNFDFYIPYGSTNWGKVLITSYYEPEINGSLTPTDVFTEPMLATPNDLVEVALGRTDDRFADMGQVRGRMAKEKTARGTASLVPYFTREEISNGALKNRKLEIVWTDPVDAFFLQIQGSGIVKLPDGGIVRLGYADQNGHPYAAIGRFLRKFIPLEKITQQTIEAHLRGLEPDKRRQLLNRNPSYVFFSKRDGPALTSVGTPAITGRTIATDARYFPKGALAFLVFEKPRFASPQATEPEGWNDTSRFVLDQDTGGAIKGGGRLDLFWGTGDEAKQHAGVIKQNGTLYYLVPKKELRARLSALKNQLAPHHSPQEKGPE